MKTNVLKLLSKKKLRYRLFFVYFLIIFMFSRTTFLQNTSGRLLLYFVHEIHECSSLWASAFTFVNTDISIRRWGSQISLKFRRTPIISSPKLSCNGKVAYIDLDFASQKSVKWNPEVFFFGLFRIFLIGPPTLFKSSSLKYWEFNVFVIYRLYSLIKALY